MLKPASHLDRAWPT